MAQLCQIAALSASSRCTTRAALAGAPEGTRLAVVFEPTGPTWMPIAVFFARRGHAVYRVSSAKAADLRRFLRRHAKTNGIDAETLARMPLADPRGLQRLELPGRDRPRPGCRLLLRPTGYPPTYRRHHTE
jgi:transposase